VEEKLGVPFVGASGKLLDLLLRTNGLRRDKAHITNAALCRGESDRDNDKAAECCAPRLLRELAELRGTTDKSDRPQGGVAIVSGAPAAAPPTILLGKTAARSVLGVTSILAARGFIFTAKVIEEQTIKAAGKAKSLRAPLRAATLAGRAALSGGTYLPTLHPAFVLRADTWKPLIEIDFNRFARLVRGEIRELADEAPYSLDFRDLKTLGPIVSLDIETDGVKVLETKMLSVQISDGSRTVVLHPWLKKYARPLSKWLRTRKTVVTHNGYGFDIIVLRQHGVF
jgi:uracil-DNA glycosylase